jgi:secreted PhoX family phosphatase
MLDENPNGSNPSSNPWLSDLIEKRADRRSVLGGALGIAAAQFLGGSLLSRKANAAASATSSTPSGLLGFTEVPPSNADTIIVPAGYTWDVLLPWGTPLFSAVAAYQSDASNTSTDQQGQVGFNHDAIFFYPIGTGAQANRRGLIAMNHEYTDASQIYTAAQGSTITNDAAGREKVAKALAGHGCTIAEVVQDPATGVWSHVVDSTYNRRITGTTPVQFSGPVSPSHPLLQSTVTPSPLGTLNNCGAGMTPWGTYLTCEENFNGYFGTTSTTWTATALESRYGVSKTGFGYNWHVAESRFDVNVNRNEVNHFGWVVEIDPFNPSAPPIKRTSLGRFKHEAAHTTISRSRACVYMGDDENGDYVYKYVSRKPWQVALAAGESPLDQGVLFVARFDANGNGTWIPLVFGAGPLTEANGWQDQADILIRTRQAADAVGATRCHRPEWITENATTRDIFVAFTNGTGNNSAVNSGRDPNPYGHIIKLREPFGDHTRLTFTWSVYMIAGDSQYDATVPATQPLFGSPDGLWSDYDGRLWIQTDISNSSQNRADRGYDRIANNQMLAADPATGELKRFLTGPRGCEITGVHTTPDGKTMFVNVQHPGESTNYWNGLNGTPSTANPSTVSTWPFGGRPRPATVVVRKLDGGVIGT